MAKYINTSIHINASPSQVWQVFMDFEAYPAWNPFIKKIEGEPIVGQRIYAEIDTFKFKPKVLVNNQEKELRWIGSVLFKGLFDGEHGFKLTATEAGTRFENTEKFTGVLPALIGSGFLEKTKDNFEKMNQALKGRVEKLV